MGFFDIIRTYFSRKGVNLIADDFTKTIGDPTPLSIALYNDDKTPITGKEVEIEIHGEKYNRKTSEDGIAKLNINLPVGIYDTHVVFDDPEYHYTRTFLHVTICPVIKTADFNMVEHDGSKFIAITEDVNGYRIGGVKITFNINGVNYERTTDNNGIASLPINLQAGDYKIITKCHDIAIENKIHIDKAPKKQTRMEGTDINMTYKDGSKYQCAVYDDVGRVSGNVRISVNGVSYDRTPDGEGLYKLAINLNPGTYPVKAEYLGDDTHLASSVNNTIVVNEAPKPTPTPQKSRSEKILDYFESKFGTCKYIDDALEKIQGRGYAFYFSDGYNMYETIDRVYLKKGANCFDIAEVLYHLAKGMNTKYGRKYEVWYLDVWCPVSGYDHIRLRLRSNGGSFFYRDGACVLDGGAVTSNWCGTSNNILEVNPSWIYDGD